MRILDSEGVERRRKHRLKRRLYQNKAYTNGYYAWRLPLSFLYVQGPNFVWHLDGYDKLKPYGFAIHGCIDG